MASRLSENPSHRVLLLEAGPEEPTITSVPVFAFGANETDYDWKFKTIPQKKACRSTGGVCRWPRGKMLCGTACLSGTDSAGLRPHVSSSKLLKSLSLIHKCFPSISVNLSFHFLIFLLSFFSSCSLFLVQFFS